MLKSVDVFTPNSFPTHTYVERRGDPIERHLANALQVKNSLISLSGPSKSGKTVLLHKLINKDDLIYVSGSSIKAPGDLWRIVLAWMGGPVVSQKSQQISGAVSASGKGEAQAGLILAKVAASGELKIEGGYGNQVSATIAHDGLIAVGKEIANSEFTVFIDDFHYIAQQIQADVARDIKAGVESGIRICVASVPHRSDDVVRSNPELRGRIYSVDTKYWEASELEAIASKGFSALNVDFSPKAVDRIVGEAFGSPQLMQAMCLNLCFKKGIVEEQAIQQRVDVTESDLRDVFELTSAGSNFQSLLESLHSGPRQRGTERKEFDLDDESKGDVYRAILLAIKDDPGQLSFTYDDMQRRVRAVCLDDIPVGGSITRSLEQMDEIAASFPPKAIEWLEDVLDIVDPYFLFYLRSSRRLQTLGAKQ